MNKQYFGTDGIRGTANSGNMTADIALKVGMAAGSKFLSGKQRHKVVIGKDTRLSGYMVEPALTAGFVSVGMDVILVGPLPTPAIAMLTRSMRADLGVMISASHNPYHDNGIKLFDPSGLKLSDEVEMEIEAMMRGDEASFTATPEKLGRAKRLDDAQGRYIEFVKQSFPRGSSLKGLKVVLDCANGAGYKIAPIILWELGAEVVTLGVEPNGFNINHECGSTAPDQLAKRVMAEKADIGIALDGDADRLIVCDEKGKIIDGDEIIAAIATHQQEMGTLKGGAVVATLMSNMGLEQYLASQNLGLHRTQVGDRYVSEYMRENGLNVGGEQSGHIILSDYTTTGDGLMAGLQLLAMLTESEKPASELFKLFEPFPQLLENIRYDPASDPLTNKAVQQAISAAESDLGEKGRVLIRKSGTEPLIRVMAEGEDEQKISAAVKHIISALKEISLAS